MENIIYKEYGLYKDVYPNALRMSLDTDCIIRFVVNSERVNRKTSNRKGQERGEENMLLSSLRD